MSMMRNKFAQTDLASILPPKSRKKSEYQSFDKIIKWAEKVLNLLNKTLIDVNKIGKLRELFDDTTLVRMRKELSWINRYKG